MKAFVRLMLIAVLGMAPGTVWAKHSAAKAPVVVELFTAQGCASCNTANALVAKLADRVRVIVLTWPVDYWDYLGWKDTFAQPGFTARQKAFGRRLGPRDVYTPQIVINGASQVSGDDATGVEALVSKSDPAEIGPPKIQLLADGRIRIGAGHAPHPTADVWLVRYEPREQGVEVKAGDNRGAVVSLRNVVRQSVRLGAWTGRTAAFKAPAAPEPGLGNVVLVQGARGGAIIAAARWKSKGG